RYIAIGGNLDSIRSILESRSALHSAGPVASFSTRAVDRLLQEMALDGPESLAERFDLGPDRADSIVPAARAYLWIAELAGLDEIHAPSVSLRDGLIHRLLEEEASL
ncbi:MAG: hypothetical protein ACYTG5_15615, partial [Planctomycetota bacterium]